MAGDRRARFQVTNRSEIEVIREMFIDRQYELDGINPRVIIDLGSNIGASLAYFRSRYPAARIVGLEPDPSTFPRLQRAVARMPGVSVYPWAVSDQTGRQRFARAAQSWASSLAPHGDVEVKTSTLPDLIAEFGLKEVDLLKLDVEGVEWAMFEHPGAFAGCRVIVGELHLNAVDQTVERAKRALAGFDVEIVSRQSDRANFVAKARF